MLVGYHALHDTVIFEGFRHNRHFLSTKLQLIDQADIFRRGYFVEYNISKFAVRNNSDNVTNEKEELSELNIVHLQVHCCFVKPCLLTKLTGA